MKYTKTRTRGAVAASKRMVKALEQYVYENPKIDNMKELCKMLGFNQTLIRKWDSGVRLITIDNIDVAKNKLGLNPASLFDDAIPAFENPRADLLNELLQIYASRNSGVGANRLKFKAPKRR